MTHARAKELVRQWDARIARMETRVRRRRGEPGWKAQVPACQEALAEQRRLSRALLGLPGPATALRLHIAEELRHSVETLETYLDSLEHLSRLEVLVREQIAAEAAAEGG